MSDEPKKVKIRNPIVNENTTTVTDKGGNTMLLMEFQGRLFTRFGLDKLKHATEMEARPDDTLMVTYPRSGTHWLFEILRLLEKGSVDVPRVEKDMYMIEATIPLEIDNYPSPRTLNTHFQADQISPAFLAKKCKIIYTTRDPRDVMASYYLHHAKLKSTYLYEGSFDDFLHLCLDNKIDYGSWFEYTKNWEKLINENPDIPILVLSYESMKTNPIENISKISKFMGYTHTDDFFKQVAQKTSIETMRNERSKPGEVFGQTMYRKGVVGDWKNWFTVAQLELFNEVFEKEMIGTKAYDLYSHRVSKEKKDATNGN